MATIQEITEYEAVDPGDRGPLTREKHFVIYDTQTLTANLTVTSKLSIENGGMIVTNGYTLTIEGSFHAGLYQVFNAAKNEVVFAQNIPAHPEWWGAVPDGATNCTDGIRCAIGSSLVVELQVGTYLCEETASSGDFFLYLGENDGTADRSGMFFHGKGPRSILKLGDDVGPDALLFGASDAAGDALYDCVFRDFAIDLNGPNNLQEDSGDPLRYNCAFYLYCYCENLLIENLDVYDISGHQAIRVGADSAADQGKDVTIRNCRFENFGIGLTDNDIQDTSVLYVEAENIKIEHCTFRNADHTYNLARGQTGIELHGEYHTRIQNCTFEYVQLPILVSSTNTAAYHNLIDHNTFKQCNYLMSFDSSSTGNAQSRTIISDNIYTSTKLNSVCIPIGATSEGDRTRENIIFKGNILTAWGNTNEQIHVFKCETTYLRSIQIDDNEVAGFNGCLLYMAGGVQNDDYCEVSIRGNRLDSLGPTSGSDFPTSPVMIHVDHTTGNMASLVIQDNTFYNSGGKNYATYGVVKRGGDFNYLVIKDNEFHGSSLTPRKTGTLGTVGYRYEEFYDTATWDPNNMNDGDQVSTTVTVTGAVVGDRVSVGFSTAVPAGVILTGDVTATDTVTVKLFNESGSAHNLASGTLKVRVQSG